MLIQCPECEQSVSDAAPACPQCGFPLEDPNAPKPCGRCGGIMVESMDGSSTCPDCHGLRPAPCGRCNVALVVRKREVKEVGSGVMLIIFGIITIPIIIGIFLIIAGGSYLNGKTVTELTCPSCGGVRR